LLGASGIILPVGTVVVVMVTVGPAEARKAPAGVGVDIVVTGGPVLAGGGDTLVHVVLTQSSVKPGRTLAGKRTWWNKTR